MTSIQTDAHVSHVSGLRRPGLHARLSVPGPAVAHHQRWTSVDALRAIAALMVLASHAPGPTPAPRP